MKLRGFRVWNCGVLGGDSEGFGIELRGFWYGTEACVEVRSFLYATEGFSL